MKVANVVGARPQFIKAATVSRAIANRGDVSELIIHTGQHYDADMSDVFFRDLEIPDPDYHLGIGGSSHGQMTGRQLEAIERVLMSETPDWVLVYGDTNSTLAGALAAAKLNIRVAHVEAGLRSYNRRMPEELNRIVTDHIADLLLCPSDRSMRTLEGEGIPIERIEVVGDVMFDAAKFYASRAREPRWFSEEGFAQGEFVLATVHRAENTDDPDRLRGILEGLSRATSPVVLPIHPRTRERIVAHQLTVPQNVRVVPPVGYLEMVWLEKSCRVVASDSGGVQKEAYFHGCRCVVLRDETEWVELVDAGWNAVVGVDPDLIAKELNRPAPPLNHETHWFGAGDAAERVVSSLINWGDRQRSTNGGERKSPLTGRNLP